MADFDQAFPTKPPIEFQLERLNTMLYWISEHSLELESRSTSDELEIILECVTEARGHVNRLSELLGIVKKPS